MNRLRLTEFLLLLLATVTTAAGFALLALVETGSVTWRDLQPAWLLAGALLVAHRCADVALRTDDRSGSAAAGRPAHRLRAWC